MTTNFMDLKEEDYTRYFLRDDSLRSLDSELSITLAKKYKCMSGCKMCVLKPVWMSHEDYIEYAEYAGDRLTPEWEKRFFNFADNFDNLTTLDDMRYMKRDFPKLFDFYKRNGEKFLLSSMSDQSLFYHYPIIMNEIKFKDIYELSFSDVFLGRNAEKLKEVFKDVGKRYNINQIKVITGNTEATKAELAKVSDFFKFCEDNDIGTYRHHDFRKEWKAVENEAHPVYSEGGLPYPLLNTVLFMAFDSMYLQLQDFTVKDWKDLAACTLDEVKDMSDLLPRVLETKLEIYKDSSENLLDKDHQYVKYFGHCAKTFKVNRDYNFIPYILLRDYAKWCNKLIESGEWIKTDAGLIRSGTKSPVSIIEVK